MRNPVRTALFLGGAALLGAVAAPPWIASACKTVFVLVLGALMVMAIKRFSGASTRREVGFVLILVTVSTGLALVGAEFAIRFVYRDVSTTADGRSYFSVRWRRSVARERNALGFREKEITAKAPGVFRVAVVGDSFTEGQGIAIDDRPTELLQLRLDETEGGRFEVLNFGRSGAASDDHLTMLREDVLDASADFVILQWLTNDVMAHDDTGAKDPIRLLPSDRLRAVLQRNSALYHFINSGWERLQSGLGLVEAYDDILIREFGNPSSSAWSRVDERMSEFVRVAHANDMQVGIVFFPRLEEVGGDPDRYSLGFIGDHVMSFCERNGLQCLDLRPVFAVAGPAPSLWANRLDPHPGRAANLLASEAIHQAFSEWWQVPSVGENDW